MNDQIVSENEWLFPAHVEENCGRKVYFPFDCDSVRHELREQLD